MCLFNYSNSMCPVLLTVIYRYSIHLHLPLNDACALELCRVTAYRELYNFEGVESFLQCSIRIIASHCWQVYLS